MTRRGQESLPGWQLRDGRLVEAQAALAKAIKASDRPVPCLLPGPNLWLSERRAERREAVKRCGVCPVLAECALIPAVLPEAESWGVFGGRDYAAIREHGPHEPMERLRWLSRKIVRGRAGAAARAKRNALLARLAADTQRKTTDLARAAGLSSRHCQAILHAQGVVRPRVRRPVDNTRYRALLLRERRRKVARLVDGPPQLERLRALGRVSRGARGDAQRAERNRLIIELKLSDPRYWTLERLAAAAGLSVDPIVKIIRNHRAGIPTLQRPVGIASTVDLRVQRRRRRERHLREIAARSADPRLRRLDDLASLADRRRDPVLKAEQAELAASLRLEDPHFWTVERLSLVLNRAPGDLVFCLLQRRTRAARALPESTQIETQKGVAG